jgi:hypothetical protein
MDKSSVLKNSAGRMFGEMVSLIPGTGNPGPIGGRHGLAEGMDFEPMEEEE